MESKYDLATFCAPFDLKEIDEDMISGPKNIPFMRKAATAAGEGNSNRMRASWGGGSGI
jgi:hypothetical protein